MGLFLNVGADYVRKDLVESIRVGEPEHRTQERPYAAVVRSRDKSEYRSFEMTWNEALDETKRLMAEVEHFLKYGIE